jgi:CBS-domain-containing membrane protein
LWIVALKREEGPEKIKTVEKDAHYRLLASLHLRISILVLPDLRPWIIAMPSLPGRLGTLRARDVMTRNLIVIRDSYTIEQAIGELKSHHITGAPIVNDSGKFVGILSMSDLLRGGAAGSQQRSAKPTPLAHGEGKMTWDLFDLASPVDAATGEELVAERMSTVVTSVTTDAPLVEVARVMCSGHWHRVPVVEESGQLAGIISTMDVLAAIVNAADELQ